MEIISFAVIKLSLISLLGFYLYKKTFINDEVLRFLTFFVVNITVPFLIFSHLIENSKVVLSHNIWIFIAFSIIVFVTGYLLGLIFSFKREHKFKSELISSVSFQNAGYLPMNIAFFIFGPSMREEFFVYIFLYLLGFNILMWSLGSFLTFKKSGQKFKSKSIFTPPILSTLFALLLIYGDIASFIPEIIITPVKMVGEISFVLSMVILGCWLAKAKIRGISKNLFLLGEVSLIKLVILPLLCLIGLLNFKIFSLLGVFMILEAAMPTAVTLPIVADLRAADSEFVSQGVFLTHIFSVLTIPVWLGIYLRMSGFSLSL